MKLSKLQLTTEITKLSKINQMLASSQQTCTTKTEKPLDNPIRDLRLCPDLIKNPHEHLHRVISKHDLSLTKFLLPSVTIISKKPRFRFIE